MKDTKGRGVGREVQGWTSLERALSMRLFTKYGETTAREGVVVGHPLR